MRRTYLIGEQINFEIIITNTGNTTLNVVEFWDRWDSNYIRFNNGYIIKNNLTINDISQIITEQNNSQIYIADITNSILGDLEPGESFLIYLNFTAVNPTPFYVGETCNNAIASGDEIPEVRDKVCFIYSKSKHRLVKIFK
ncbi:MAG: hypothetical protein KatS3mg085_548 [Candidatus Dojkabacteria bacterium]|nr:MAG: hypothetical protein KatS3mg085_548 [Candidatus Dojkabacteria bacterium]